MGCTQLLRWLLETGQYRWAPAMHVQLNWWGSCTRVPSKGGQAKGAKHTGAKQRGASCLQWSCMPAFQQFQRGMVHLVAAQSYTVRKMQQGHTLPIASPCSNRCLLPHLICRLRNEDGVRAMDVEDRQQCSALGHALTRG